MYVVVYVLRPSWFPPSSAPACSRRLQTQQQLQHLSLYMRWHTCFASAGDQIFSLHPIWHTSRQWCSAKLSFLVCNFRVGDDVPRWTWLLRSSLPWYLRDILIRGEHHLDTYRGDRCNVNLILEWYITLQLIFTWY